MRSRLRRAALWIVIVSALPCSVFAQQGNSNRRVILRRDPSTSSPALAHLSEGTRLTLIDARPDSGFYHVRTEDDQVGWVWAKFLSVTSSPKTTPAGEVSPTVQALPSAGTGCDESLWSHVYHSQRLIVREQCSVVTGTIVDATAGKKADGVRHERDGDTHGWLKIDSGFENMLNAGNVSDEGGNLVFEIVCRFPVTQTDAKAACQGYTDHVTLPPVGSHVRVVGTHVQDTFHAKWMEIHPVTSITVIR
jgi:hypothetical protein